MTACNSLKSLLNQYGGCPDDVSRAPKRHCAVDGTPQQPAERNHDGHRQEGHHDEECVGRLLQGEAPRLGDAQIEPIAVQMGDRSVEVPAMDQEAARAARFDAQRGQDREAP